MPRQLDTSIYARPAQSKLSDPFTLLSDVAKLRSDYDVAEEKRRLAQQSRDDDEALREAFRVTNGDPNAAIEILAKQGRGTMAQKLRGEQQEILKKASETKISQNKQYLEEVQHATTLLQGVSDDATYQQRRPLIEQRSPALASILPLDYDKDIIDGIMQVNLNAKQMLDSRLEALKAWNAGDTDGGFLRYLWSTQNDEEWQNVLEEAPMMGVSAATIRSVPKTWSPENVIAVGKRAIGPEKFAEQQLKREAEARAVTAAQSLAKYRQGMVDARNRAVDISAKRATAGAAGGTGDAVLLRQAAMWRANQLNDLRQNARDNEWDEDTIAEETAAIEAIYRSMIGAPDTDDADDDEVITDPFEAADAVGAAAGAQFRAQRREAGKPPRPTTKVLRPGAPGYSPSLANRGGAALRGVENAVVGAITAPQTPGAGSMGVAPGGGPSSAPQASAAAAPGRVPQQQPGAKDIPDTVSTFLSKPNARPGIYKMRVNGKEMSFEKRPDGTIVPVKK